MSRKKAPRRGFNVYVGLGANIAPRLARLRRAAAGLDRLPGTTVLRLSPVYETSPVGPKQKDFLNAVAKIRTALSPEDLLAALKSLERAHGRKPRRRWGPREIDLDILLYGAVRKKSRRLTVPHPRWRERLFVLWPLTDVAPGLTDPVTKRPARRILSELTAPDQSIRLYRKRFPRP